MLCLGKGCNFLTLLKLGILSMCHILLVCFVVSEGFFPLSLWLEYKGSVMCLHCALSLSSYVKLN